MKHLYYNMSCRVTIGAVVFDRVHSILIDGTIKRLADTAVIKLPREFTRAKINNSDTSLAGVNISDYIKTGDPVKIELGYDGDLKTEFTGYLEKIGADVPLELTCIDEMYHLKRSNFTDVLKSASLLDLLKKIAPGYQYDVIDNIPLGKFVINNASAFEVLETLRKDYGLHARFKENALVVGFPVDNVPSVTHRVVMNRNVRAQSNDLKFVTKDEFKVLLKGISMNSDGSRYTAEFGDKGGAQRTLHFTNKSKSELKKLTEKNHKSLSFDGYQGTLPTWGDPQTRAGDAIQIADPFYQNSDRDGKYLIEGVTVLFNGNDGFKRVNKLGLKL